MSKINQFGRSMVEMLGVLAIVGVLSVGAITGYSKAMMKYKLNKQTEQIGSIIDNMHIHIEELVKAKEGMNASNGTDLKSILIKMNIIPKEMIIGSNIKDIFGNNVNFGITVAQGYHWFETTIQTGGNKDICINLFKISIQKKSDISRVKIHKNGSTMVGTAIQGDKDCTSQYTCLKNMTLSDIEEKCSACDDTIRCTFYFQDKYK